MLEAIREKIGQVADVGAAIALLGWDQETYMPPKGATARAQQLATLSALAHRLFTDPELGALLKNAQEHAETLEPDEAKLVAETLHDYERATRLPESFVHAFAEEQSNAFNTWLEARPQSNFAVFKPHLQKLLDLNRQKADLLGFEGSPYNALLEDFERGMTAENLKILFADLAPRQADLVQRIVSSSHRPDLAWLDRHWDEAAQWALSLRVLADMGFDLEAGRQDKSAHPFTTNFDIQDVRITTRVDTHSPFPLLYASMHEGGHALYEQGFPEKDRRTTLAQAPSLGIHESQSRMWENMVGRSRAFWDYCAPIFHEFFPDLPNGVGPDDFWHAANFVEPSLIRVEADECTYNLHIIVRFELEVDLLEGRLRVDDVPEAWNAKMKQYLGVDVPDDAQGCLQDVHWSHGAMGYFPTYTLGNLYAAQLFEAIQRDLPDLWDRVRSGNFGPLLGWLRANVHAWGRRKLAPEIVRDATGAEPASDAYLRYLEGKYGELYSLS